jgi:hypothetical protein
MLGDVGLERGNGTTLAAQLPNILAGRAYINFHTTQYGGGEIRGFLAPEPGTLALLGLGVVGPEIAPQGRVAFRKTPAGSAQWRCTWGTSVGLHVRSDA